MYYFNADARDGGASNVSACNTCCCNSVFLRPGETNMIMMNYAPWVLPIMPPGLISGGTEYTVELNSDACADNAVDGFLPPSNTNYELTTLANTALAIDLSVNEAPAGNDFNYEIVALAGPSRGSLTPLVPNGPAYSYVPAGGYTGYDYFSYRMTDAQGRSVIRSVRVSVGTHNQLPDVGRMSLVPYVDLGKTKVDQRMQTLQFAVVMPISCRPCESYRLTVQQSAMDCERNLYKHRSCFDLSCKDCG